MYCLNCGEHIEPDAKFCRKCGNSVTKSAGISPSIQTPPIGVQQQHAGRGGTILTLGILAIGLLGPITGIPAWVMGSGDLQKINKGIIAASSRGLTKGGMVCGIIGTFFSPLWLIIMGIIFAVGISMFSSSSVQSNKDALINDINNLAANAYQFRIRPNTMGGGGGVYTGYTIPSKLLSNENGSYSATAIAAQVTFVGTSAQGYGTVQAICDSTGKLGTFTYTGQFP